MWQFTLSLESELPLVGAALTWNLYPEGAALRPSNGGFMSMHARWLILAVLALMVVAATGCATSRSGRYGQYGRYGTVYDQRGRGIYAQRDRDYRWERQQREREEWRRRQRRYERYERRHTRDWDNDDRRR
jgi:hypothetical protein